MSDASWQEEVPKYVRVMQIIVAALVLGCVFFLAIVLVVKGPAVERADDGRTPLISYVALAFLLASVVARVVAPPLVVRTGRRNIARGTFRLPVVEQTPSQSWRETWERMGDAGKLLLLFQTKTIIGAAILEGVTFFMLIAYMVERYTPILAVAIALILAIAAHMPTSRGVVHWIEDQLRLMREERSMLR